jgi:hypothetical protein
MPTRDEKSLTLADAMGWVPSGHQPYGQYYKETSLTDRFASNSLAPVFLRLTVDPSFL